MSEPRRNVELKAVDRDPAATLSAALGAGAADHGVLVQRDTYFGVPLGRLKLREEQPGGATLIAYERPDDPTVRLSRYQLIGVADPAAAHAGLESTCGVRAVVDKRRRLLLLDNVRIHLDEVDGLGCFCELEAVAAPDADLHAERAKVDHLRELLDIRDADLRPGSYADALAPRPDPELLAAARAAMAQAYAPYSTLEIGAALRTDDGRMFTGTNVENAAFPQGQCAEAGAVGAMAAAGGRRIVEVVVASERGIAPCGGCRQRLKEFAAAETVVHLAGSGPVVRTHTLGELLPHAFEQTDVPG